MWIFGTNDIWLFGAIFVMINKSGSPIIFICWLVSCTLLGYMACKRHKPASIESMYKYMKTGRGDKKV